MPRPEERKWIDVKTTRKALENEVGDITVSPSSIYVTVGGFFIGLINPYAGAVLGAVGVGMLSRDVFVAEHKNAILNILNDLKTADDKAVIYLSQEYKYHVKGGWIPTNNFKVKM